MDDVTPVVTVITVTMFVMLAKDNTVVWDDDGNRKFFGYIEIKQLNKKFNIWRWQNIY